jgi:hypothetical protein
LVSSRPFCIFPTRFRPPIMPAFDPSQRTARAQSARATMWAVPARAPLHRERHAYTVN